MSAEERNQDQKTNQGQNQGNQWQDKENQAQNQGNQEQNQGNQWQNQGDKQGQDPQAGTERTGANMHANQDSNLNSGTGKNTAPFQITGNWEKQSSQLKEQYSQLTASDLNFQPGQESQLLDKLSTKLNKSRDEVINILNQSNESGESNQPDRFNL